MSQQMPYLPTEVIYEILLRLPVKSVLRFRSVSKSWLSLLSSPQFINTHLNFSRNNHKNIPHKLLLLTPGQNLPKKECTSVSEKPSFDFVGLDYPVKSTSCVPQFIGSCNGLVCLSVENTLILWNPSTRIWKEIPKEVPFMNKDYIFTYGFGYDELNDDYKLVLVYSSKKIKNGGNEVTVYSLKTNSWKWIKGFNNNGYVYSNYGVIVNGIVHWDTRPNLDFVCGHSVVTFDLVTEKQGKLDLPKYDENEDVHWDLMSSRESLFGFCHCESQGEVDIWVMKEYGVEESWTKFASVAYYVIPGIFYSPLYINEDGDVLVIDGESLVLYNMRNNVYKDLQIRIPDARRRIDMATYNESLVSPVF